jgi:hypothetical protein
MPKLRFVRPAVEPARAPDSPAAPRLTVLLGRREFLKAVGVVLAALAAPALRLERAWAAARGRFFTRQERATLEALCDVVLPPDADPGASALGAADYIEGLLTAFDHHPPRIFAGGPFSGRNPFPDQKTGTPSHRRPRNAFKRFIQLTRVQEVRWRAELFGSAQVPGADFNDAALGPLKGLRDVYRESLAHVDDVARTVAGNVFPALTDGQKATVFGKLDGGDPNLKFTKIPRRDANFITILIQHVLEGCLAPPEYGGNRDLGGWKLVGLEGDNQPLGYSLFSTADGTYHERPDHPMSTPNPDEIDPATMMLTPKPLAPISQSIQMRVATASNGLSLSDLC